MLRKIAIVILLIFISGVFIISLGQERKDSKSDSPKDKNISQAEKFLELSKSNFVEGKIDLAIYYAKKAVNLDNKNADYHLWLGRVYGEKAQKASLLSKFSYAKKCKLEWEKAVQLDGKNLDARFSLMNYYFQAPGFAGGDIKKAREQASEIAKIDPSYGHLAYAQIYEHEKDYSKAEQEYKKAIEVNPKETQPYLNLGFFYQNRKKYTKAKEIFLKLLEVNPNEMDAYYQLGRTALFSGKDLEKGIEYYKKYLEVEPKPTSPSWSSAHWRMGMIYEKLGKKKDAIKAYKKALELNPDNKEAKEALKNVEK